MVYLEFKKGLTILAVFLLSALPIAQAATITADSCSQEDVQAAVDSANYGDTVLVPAGECEWNKQRTIPNNKKVILQGVGATSTIITWEGIGAAIDLGISGSRLTGIKFILPSGTSNFAVHVDGHGWRIDHCEFESRNESTRDGIHATGAVDYDPTGVIDNCTFKNTRVVVFGDLDLKAYKSWYNDYRLGSLDFVFIEDCYFTNDAFNNSIDAHYGGNYIFRYNTVNNAYIEVHSNSSIDGSTDRAGRLWGIYNNTLVAEMTYYTPFRLRGGTGVVYNNKISGDYTDPNILIDNVRTYKGYCTEFPCRDQIGRGRDLWLWTDENPNPTQASEPAYAWNNIYVDSGGFVKFKVINNCQDVLQEGRDFFNDTPKPGYKPYIYPHPLTVAPFGADICGEGEITDECWCQGMKTKGYCMHGYYYKDGTDLEGYPTYDVNQDGDINIQDIQLIVNVILGGTSNSRAEVNGDESVNVQDVQEVANEMLR